MKNILVKRLVSILVIAIFLFPHFFPIIYVSAAEIPRLKMTVSCSPSDAITLGESIEVAGKIKNEEGTADSLGAFLIFPSEKANPDEIRILGLSGGFTGAENYSDRVMFKNQGGISQGSSASFVLKIKPIKTGLFSIEDLIITGSAGQYGITEKENKCSIQVNALQSINPAPNPTPTPIILPTPTPSLSPITTITPAPITSYTPTPSPVSTILPTPSLIPTITPTPAPIVNYTPAPQPTPPILPTPTAKPITTPNPSLIAKNAPQTPIIIFPQDLYYNQNDSVKFEGIGTPGSSVFIFREGMRVGVTIVNPQGKWAIEKIPTLVGNNPYAIWAMQYGKESRKVVYQYERYSWNEQQRINIVKSADSPIGRVITGDPQDLKEVAGSTALDLFVIGDVRDVGKQSYLYITRSSDFNSPVLGLSVIGILSTGGPGDAFVSGAKSVYKIVGKIALKSKPLAENFLKAAKIIGERREINSLNSLVSLAIKIEARDAKIYEKVLKNPEDVSRLARYVDTYGDSGLLLIEKMVNRLEKIKFTWTRDGLNHAFNKHWYNPNEKWRKELGIKSRLEFKQTTESVTRNGKKLIYKQWDTNKRI